MPEAPILIAARARNGVIGRNHRLPWRIPGELKHFQQRTAGHALICGRTTWASLPKALTDHDRYMVVLTRQQLLLPDRTEAAATPEDAVRLAQLLCPEKPPLVIGGAQVYAAMIDLCASIEISHIDADPEGDAVMPPLVGWEIHDAGPWQDGPPRWQLQRYTRTP